MSNFEVYVPIDNFQLTIHLEIGHSLFLVGYCVETFSIDPSSIKLLMYRLPIISQFLNSLLCFVDHIFPATQKEIGWW